jgi:hypothetical protein
MALTGWVDNTNYLFRNAAVWPGAVGFYVSAWCYRATGSAATSWIFSLFEAGTDHRSLFAETDDVIWIEASGDVSTSVAGAHANAAWFHVGAGFLAADQAVYRNASSGGASVADTVLTPTATTIGVHGAGGNSASWANAGALAEISVWDTTGMTTGNVTSLDAKLYNGGAGGAGANPLNVDAELAQPWTGKLVAYVIDSANSLTDLAGNGHNFTMQGTLTNFASHPTIDAPGVALPPLTVSRVN